MAKNNIAQKTVFQVFQEALQGNPEALHLIRSGDFYETFNESARTVARIVGLTLTQQKGRQDGPVMSGFPFHMLESVKSDLESRGITVNLIER